MESALQVKGILHTNHVKTHKLCQLAYFGVQEHITHTCYSIPGGKSISIHSYSSSEFTVGVKLHFRVLDGKPVVVRSLYRALFWVLPVKHCIRLKQQETITSTNK